MFLPQLTHKLKPEFVVYCIFQMQEKSGEKVYATLWQIEFWSQAKKSLYACKIATFFCSKCLSKCASSQHIFIPFVIMKTLAESTTIQWFTGHSIMEKVITTQLFRLTEFQSRYSKPSIHELSSSNSTWKSQLLS